MPRSPARWRSWLLDEKGSAEELFRAVETAVGGKIYVSPLIAPLALENRSKLCLRTRQCYFPRYIFRWKLIHRN
jgi:hypothetical protein